MDTNKDFISELKTIDDTVDFWFSWFTGMEKIPQAKTEDLFAAYCHSQLSGGIGMTIRNQLRLWDDRSDLHIYFKTTFGCKHPDEMSDLIIRNVYRRIMK